MSKKVVSIQEHKDSKVGEADKVLVPLYNELADLELRVKLLRGKIQKKERELLSQREATHRQIMRRADKLDW